MAQEIWFRDDLKNLIAGISSAPVPAGDYAAGWLDALGTLAVALGIERRRDAPVAPVVRVMPTIDTTSRELTRR